MKWLILTTALVAMLSAGCNAKLNSVSTFTIPDGDQIAKILSVPPRPAGQTIHLDLTSDQPVDLYIMLITKETTGIEAMSPDEWKKKSLRSFSGITSEKSNWDIPANNGLTVIVTPAAKTTKATATVKLTNG